MATLNEVLSNDRSLSCPTKAKGCPEAQGCPTEQAQGCYFSLYHYNGGIFAYSRLQYWSNRGSLWELFTSI